ncbi:YidB family protein [Streptomyces sp. NPDC059649]|uniref:YidB family protein n=1 Tax=Streptomyces sp. NPDC059649 TaxID=3346895 RepID=UPI0036B55CB9
MTDALQHYYCAVVIPALGVPGEGEDEVSLARSQGLVLPLAQMYQARSWISTEDNAALSPQDVIRALGQDNLAVLAESSKQTLDEIVAEVVEKLPALVAGASSEGTLVLDPEHPSSVVVGAGKIVLARISE